MKFLALWLLHVVLQDPLTNHIERLLFRQQVDSALQVIDQNLPAKQDYIYWRLLLSKGEALQKKGKYSAALPVLYQVYKSTDSYPDLYARTCMELALVHELTNSPVNVKHYLHLAKSRIEEFDLDSLRPEYNVRYSSYLRIYEREVPIEPYLEEGEKLAKKFNKVKEMAEIHSLRAARLPGNNHSGRLTEYLASIRSYSQISDWGGMSSLYFLAARSLFRMDDYAGSLKYIDSAIYFGSKVPDEMISHFLADPYLLKTSILEKQGKEKEAYVAYKMGSSYAMEDLENKLANQVAEVEAAYRSEELKQENRIKTWILLGSLLALFLSLALILTIRCNAKRLKSINSSLNPPSFRNKQSI